MSYVDEFWGFDLCWDGQKSFLRFVKVAGLAGQAIR